MMWCMCWGMETSKQTTYGVPAPGIYLDPCDRSAVGHDVATIELAESLGMDVHAEVRELLDACGLDDDERSDGPDIADAEQLAEAAEEALAWLTEQETRPGLRWGRNEDGAVGLFAV